MNLIADEAVFFRSPFPDVYCYSPALCRLSGGRLVASFDLGGPGTPKLEGPRSGPSCDGGTGNLCKVFISDDHGLNWRHTGDFPMLHARPFEAGKNVYLLGHCGELKIAVSRDGGESWSEVTTLNDQEKWHQAPCAVDYRHGNVYLVMEQVIPGATWPGVAPVLMRGDCRADLTKQENWTFSNPLYFKDFAGTLPAANGVPFYRTGRQTPEGPQFRFCGDPGVLESHVLRIYDPGHSFYDPDDRRVMILMRCHTGLTNIGCMAQGMEMPDGTLKLTGLTTPGGAPLAYASLPGGHMKFHIVYDEVTRLYFLVSSQSTDSMTRPQLLGQERYGLPDNERHRLALYFSCNLFDWCFAGMVAIGSTPRCSRHYASMIIDGQDLLILSRSGDENAVSAHNGNMLTLHRVPDFRNLVY